jgi:hypothetical protein
VHDVAIVDFVGIDAGELPRLVDSTIDHATLDLNPMGLLWVACEFDLQDMANTGPFVLAQAIAGGCGWRLQNIIVYPNFSRSQQSFAFTDACEFYLMFVHNAVHRFNKDLVREEHIWQHAEWGKREKNYYPLGKDPGNVWLPTIDDGKGNVTGHVALRLEDVFARCLLLGVPRSDEVATGTTAMKGEIYTRREVNTGEILNQCRQTAGDRLVQFQQAMPQLERDEARNALMRLLDEQVRLPLGQFAFNVISNGREFSVIRTSTGECTCQAPVTPAAAELWALATQDVGEELRYSKAFKIENAQNRAAKVRATIEGGWIPDEWDIQVSAL